MKLQFFPENGPMSLYTFQATPPAFPYNFNPQGISSFLV